MAGEICDQSNRVQAKQAVAHVAVEVGEAQAFGEQFAVDVGERGQRFVEVLLPLLRRRVENVEEPGQVRPEVGAVRLRAVLDVEPERLALEDARVFAQRGKTGRAPGTVPVRGPGSRPPPARRADRP